MHRCIVAALVRELIGLVFNELHPLFETSKQILSNSFAANMNTTANDTLHGFLLVISLFPL